MSKYHQHIWQFAHLIGGASGDHPQSALFVCECGASKEEELRREE